MAFNIERLKEMVQAGKASFTVIEGGESDQLGGVTMPARLEVTVHQYDRNTGERKDDKVISFTEDDIDAKITKSDNLGVILRQMKNQFNK